VIRGAGNQGENVKDVLEGQGFEKNSIRQEGTRTRVLEGLLLYNKRDWQRVRMKGKSQQRRASCLKMSRDRTQVGHRWLVPVILATQEAEIRRIAVRG
jgi:hypothetical protein